MCILVMIIVLLEILLTACNLKADIYFYPNESWKVNTTNQIDPGIFHIADQIIGGFISDYLPFGIPDAILDKETYLEMGLDALVNQYGSQGINARWSQNGETHILTAQGRSHPKFVQLIPGVIKLTPVVRQNNQFHLYISIGGWNISTAAFFQHTFTLHKGRITSSNAVEVQGGTATWSNPVEIDVVFTPACSSIPLACIWMMGGLVLAAGGVALAFSLRGQPFPMRGERATCKAEGCAKCGMPPPILSKPDDSSV